MSGLWIATAGLLGLSGGLTLGVWLGRNFEWTSTASEPVAAPDAAPDATTPLGAVTVDDMEPLMRDAAERWAASIGRPEAAWLVLQKLRTLHELRYGQGNPDPGRWS